MIKLKRLFAFLVICLPATCWGTNMHYTLDVQIDPAVKKITGIARIKADKDTKINLGILNLKNLEIKGDSGKDFADNIVGVELEKDKEITINYEAQFDDMGMNFIDKKTILLMNDWYPVPDNLIEYELSVTLPSNFIAVSESDKIQIEQNGDKKTVVFQFNHPLDVLHLVASTDYVLREDQYNDIRIESYFFKDDLSLADTYIEYTKKYLTMYEKMLTPYPYRRFAIVENIFPSGNSMPTFTLLGKQVVNLPFIVKTSLGHEILHQWFGNSVYIDFEAGNWAEGLTSYLSDHYYAALKGNGKDYRKKIMVDYNAYVNKDNAMAVSDFMTRHNKSESAVGYGKSAMFFHELRKRYKDKLFFDALRRFIRKNTFREASWHDIQDAFEKITKKKLYIYFGNYLTRKDIPKINVAHSSLFVDSGKLMLKFDLLQSKNPYSLDIPITVYTDSGQSAHWIHTDKIKEKVEISLDDPPVKVVIDENYDMMRQLSFEEIPPVLSCIMGKEKLIAIVSSLQRSKYQPLIDSMGLKNILYLPDDKITFDQIKNNSFLIAGYNNSLVDRLFGKQTKPSDGVGIKIYKNPYNPAEFIGLFHVKDKKNAREVQRTLSHYGKYTQLAFNDGHNSFKKTAAAQNGIAVFSRPATRAVKPETLSTINDILFKLESSKIIYVGEQHDMFAHHINQLEIIKKIHSAGYKLAVGMEMFQRPFQNVVDDYIEGRIDEKMFLQKTEYFSRWRYDYNFYKPIVDYLKKEKIPLVALNIPGDISRKVAREGIYGLSEKDKKQIPVSMDISNEQYRMDLKNIFSIHKNRAKLEESNYFLQAQMLWDETMAETAYRYKIKNPDVKLIILAGNGHVRLKYGIPQRLYRRNQEPYCVVVQDEDIEDGIADYVLLTTRLDGKKSPKLGVVVEENKNGLVIMDFADNSPAKKADLMKGDIIKMFAGQPIQTLSDLKLALFYGQTGIRIKIRVERDGKILDKEIRLFPLNRFHHSGRF